MTETMTTAEAMDAVLATGAEIPDWVMKMRSIALGLPENAMIRYRALFYMVDRHRIPPTVAQGQDAALIARLMTWVEETGPHAILHRFAKGLSEAERDRLLFHIGSECNEFHDLVSWLQRETSASRKRAFAEGLRRVRDEIHGFATILRMADQGRDDEEALFRLDWIKAHEAGCDRDALRVRSILERHTATSKEVTSNFDPQYWWAGPFGADWTFAG